RKEMLSCYCGLRPVPGQDLHRSSRPRAIDDAWPQPFVPCRLPAGLFFISRCRLANATTSTVRIQAGSEAVCRAHKPRSLQMGLFKRVSDIISANLNDMADKYEDPEKMLKQAVREMEESIETARRDVAKAMASDKIVAKELAGNEQKAAQWQERAE